MIKFIAKIVLVVVFIVANFSFVFAQEKSVNIYFFWGNGCPHCAKAKPFLEKMTKKYNGVKVYPYEVWGSSVNRQLLSEVGNKIHADVAGVPFIVIGDEAIVGFSEPVISGQIDERIKYCLSNNCHDSVAEIIKANPFDTSENDSPKEIVADIKKSSEKANNLQIVPEKLSLPVLGDVTTKNLSLPVFTIVLGLLDGFNPCAMWILLFLISLLLGMKDKKRRWILGSAFIITSAGVYFLFMAAWLNLLLFIGFIVWVRLAIALIAVFGGGYNLREYFVDKDGGCKVTGDEKMQKIFEKLKNITHEKKFLIALGGIMLLSFAVNLVELICSAGFPVIFTQVLAMSNLAKWQYYAYMLLYILFFMLDDLFVFFTAMITLEMTGLSTKYSRISHFVGGILMLIIGMLLIFKPEWLMFS